MCDRCIPSALYYYRPCRPGKRTYIIYFIFTHVYLPNVIYSRLWKITWIKSLLSVMKWIYQVWIKKKLLVEMQILGMQKTGLSFLEIELKPLLMQTNHVAWLYDFFIAIKKNVELFYAWRGLLECRFLGDLSVAKARGNADLLVHSHRDFHRPGRHACGNEDRRRGNAVATGARANAKWRQLRGLLVGNSLPAERCDYGRLRVVIARQHHSSEAIKWRAYRS